MDKKRLQQKADAVNDIIYPFLPESSAYTALITEAVAYSVRAGGKRLRPMLMQETYRLFAGSGEDRLLYAFMAAIEFIHTYSLVHDDLPAMDNDLLRRGLPTTHAKYGEAFGILAGDALLNYAFEVPLQAMEAEENPERIRRAVRALAILGSKAGISGMIGGQCLDVYAEQNPDFRTKEEELLFIYYNKTSALLQAAMMIGAILAGASEEEVETAGAIAGDVGIAFQIRDDILDVSGEEAVIGKPVGSDEKNQKVTYLSLKGMEASAEDVRAYTDSALQKLGSLQKENQFLEELIRYLIDRDN